LQKKDESTISLKLQVFCTTKIYYALQLEFSTVPFRVNKDSPEEEPPQSGGLFCCKPKKEIPVQWTQYVGLAIESKDSASIDHDDLSYTNILGNFAKGKFQENPVIIQQLGILTSFLRDF
jgi:hypothetical protein